MGTGNQNFTGRGLIGVALIDPDTGAAYKAGFNVTNVEGDFDPTGLATERGQQDLLSALQGLTFYPATQDVRLMNESLPLPAGAATAAGISTLGQLLERVVMALEGQQSTAITNESLPVTLASIPLAPGAATAAAQQSIVDTLLAGLKVNVQGTVPVSIGDAKLQIGGAVEITNQQLEVRIANTSLPISGDVRVTNERLNVQGDVRLVASDVVVAVSDNGTSLTVDDGGMSLTIDTPQLPASLGKKASSGSLSVTMATDEVLPVRSTPAAGAAAVTSVPSSASSVTLIAANAQRRGLYVFNNSASPLYLNLSGGAASTTSGSSMRLDSYQTWESGAIVPTNAITGIWASVNGTAQITEMS